MLRARAHASVRAFTAVRDLHMPLIALETFTATFKHERDDFGV